MSGERPSRDGARHPRRRRRPDELSRRALLLGGAAIGGTAGGAAYLSLRPPGTPARDEEPTERAAPSPVRPRPLGTRPPQLLDPVVVDLTDFDPTAPMPGWDGSRPSQSSVGMFPQDRDLLVTGHGGLLWAGGGSVRGGRNVHWVGGAYARGPWLRDFTGHGCVEGVLVRHTFVPEGAESGDGVTLVPAASTLGSSDISVLNCRVENIDGLVEGSHGDCFQLPSSYDPPDGYSSTPRTATIERFTGSTGYQGFFLANQHFDSRGYDVSCELVRLIDVNLSKTRPQIMRTPGVPREGHVRLLYLVDLSPTARGDRAYPRTFENVHLQPWSDEGIDGCVFPFGASGRPDLTDTALAPMVSADGRTAVFPSSLLVAGEVTLGPPASGDFAREAGPDGVGGLDVPGIGYRSPGYLG